MHSKMIQSFICGHLQVALEGAKCELGRGYPSECLGCSAYLPGQTMDDGLRREAWQHVLDRMAAPSWAEIAASVQSTEERINRQIEEIKDELHRQDKAIQELTRRLAHLLAETKALR